MAPSSVLQLFFIFQFFSLYDFVFAISTVILPWDDRLVARDRIQSCTRNICHFIENRIMPGISTRTVYCFDTVLCADYFNTVVLLGRTSTHETRVEWWLVPLQATIQHCISK